MVSRLTSWCIIEAKDSFRTGLQAVAVLQQQQVRNRSKQQQQQQTGSNERWFMILIFWYQSILLTQPDKHAKTNRFTKVLATTELENLWYFFWYQAILLTQPDKQAKTNRLHICSLEKNCRPYALILQQWPCFWPARSNQGQAYMNQSTILLIWGKIWKFPTPRQ